MSELDRQHEGADRDQLWASLRPLRPAVDRLAAGGPDGSDFDLKLVALLAGVVAAELDYRAAESNPGPDGPPPGAR